MRNALTLATVFILTAIFVIVPYLVWGEQIELWAGQVLARTTSPLLVSVAVFLLLCADLVLPLPSSLIALGAGSKLGAFASIFPIFLGLMAGNLLGYALGRKFGDVRARNRTQPETPYFKSVTGVLLCVTRVVPVLAESAVVTAGAGHISLRTFLVSTGLGNLGFAVAYSAMGQMLGNSESLIFYLIAAVAMPLLCYGMFLLFQNRVSNA